jgi:hypothetical protein
MGSHIGESIDRKYKKAFDKDVDWMKHAECKGMTHLFYEPHNEKENARTRREALARAICKVCPVAIECKEFARRNSEYGIWGDELEIERWRKGYIANDISLKHKLRGFQRTIQRQTN